MKKNIKLNIWLWKWHFIAGIISLPFIILLAITGGIYLFKYNYEKPIHDNIKAIQKLKSPISYQKQLELAIASTNKKIHSVVLPTNENQATEFISGKFSRKIRHFIDPYTATVTGKISSNNTFMHTIRKLHGELLLGSFGTKIVELIACWMLVLIITGICIWFPVRKFNIKHLFLIRFRKGKRILYRDLHAITGIWISIMLLITLAGGLPWTDVFGGGFKWVQKVTDTGYPISWSGRGIQSISNNDTPPLSLDKMISIGLQQNLDGIVTLTFPKGKTNVFSISNKTADLNQQKKIHFNQYTGKLITELTWSDIGVLMRARLWVMAFHQGEFGFWNWLLMLSIAILLLLMSVAAILSYLRRKPISDWGIPKVPSKFVVGKGVIIIIILLCLLLPLFGISVILIILSNQVLKYYYKKLNQPN